ncbi:MAG TPA: NAD(P)H-quinone oxidoreductase subunit L [Leptolyngbyaceae cyanobacterium]
MLKQEKIPAIPDPWYNDRQRLLLAAGKPMVMVVSLLYLILGGAYLLVLPFAVLIYLQNRWYIASSFERGFMYFMVFFFFPGLLLLAPFWNFRPKRRQIEA